MELKSYTVSYTVSQNEYDEIEKNQRTRVLKPDDTYDSENGESDELLVNIQHIGSQSSDSVPSDVVLKNISADEFKSDCSTATYREAVKHLITGFSEKCKTIPDTSNNESLQCVNNKVSWKKSSENITVKAADKFKHDIVRYTDMKFPVYTSAQNKHQRVLVEEQCMIPELDGKVVKSTVYTGDPTRFKGTPAPDDNKGKYPSLETGYGNGLKWSQWKKRRRKLKQRRNQCPRRKRKTKQLMKLEQRRNLCRSSKCEIKQTKREDSGLCFQQKVVWQRRRKKTQ